ncbi:hypothetical protein TNCV_630721 [Trichonephila clavipes]|nr:hypothetical protein TNCV_630721 [Trichonephila clavipes]
MTNNPKFELILEKKKFILNNYNYLPEVKNCCTKNEVTDEKEHGNCWLLNCYDVTIMWKTKLNSLNLLKKESSTIPGLVGKALGFALEFYGDRNDQTAVSRLLSGHLKCLTFESCR